MCKQDAHDNISYMTDDMSLPDNMDYKEFESYVRKYVIHDWEGFIRELNSFQILVIDESAGTWSIKEDNRTYKDFSQAELIKLNDTTNKKETPLEKVIDEKVNKGKRFLQRFGRSKRQL